MQTGGSARYPASRPRPDKYFGGGGGTLVPFYYACARVRASEVEGALPSADSQPCPSVDEWPRG